MRAVRAFCLLATSYALAAGCGDVTGDVIVRSDASPPPDCTSDADCRDPNPRCASAAGRCVACLEDSDCGADELCALPASVCAARCQGPESCGSLTPTCDLATGLCRACEGDVDCPTTRPHCLDSGACVECLENAHCGDDDDEDEDDDDDDDGDGDGDGDEEDDDDDDDALLCSPAGRCVECLDDGHCDDVGERCSTLLGECARPCPATGACTGEAPICDESIGYCVECRTDLECEAGEVCRGSECVD